MIKLAYCDGIAAICRGAIREFIASDYDTVITEVGPVKYDLAPEGYMLSTTKTISVTDFNGKKYKITIEEA